MNRRVIVEDGRWNRLAVPVLELAGQRHGIGRAEAVLRKRPAAVDAPRSDAQPLRDPGGEPRFDVPYRSLRTGGHGGLAAIDRPTPLRDDPQLAAQERLPAGLAFDLPARRLEDAAALEDADRVEIELVLL